MSVTLTFQSNGKDRFYKTSDLIKDMDVTEIIVENVTVPMSTYNFLTTNGSNYLFRTAGVDIVISDRYDGADQFLSEINITLASLEAGVAEFVSHISEDGVLARRLQINYVDGLEINYTHLAAAAYGLEMVSLVGSGSYIFSTPFDNIEYKSFKPNPITILYGVDGTEYRHQLDLISGFYPFNQNIIDNISAVFGDNPISAFCFVEFDFKLKKFTINMDLSATSEPVLYVTILANPAIGFTNDTRQDNQINTLTFISDRAVSLDRSTQFHISSNRISVSRSNPSILYPQNKYPIVSIPTSRTFNKMISLSPSQSIKFAKPTRFSYFDFYITDDDGNIVLFNRANWSITLTFKYTNNIII